MSKTIDNSYETAPVCGEGQTIIYAWALDADRTELPKGFNRIFISFSNRKDLTFH